MPLTRVSPVPNHVPTRIRDIVPQVRLAVLLGLAAGLPATNGMPAEYQSWAFSYSPHTLPDAVTPAGFSYDMSWNISNGRFITRVSAPTTGWVGLGIGEYGAGAMPGGDFVICTAEGTIEDRWAPGYVTPLLDANQDWTLHYSGGDAAETWCVMSRALDTGDNQDRPIDPQKLELGPINLMFAYGSSDNFYQHGPAQRSTAQIRLLESVDLMTKLWSMPDYHSNVTLGNTAVAIPHDQASCAASTDSQSGDPQCVQPHTTYHEEYHPMVAYGERSIIGATPSIDAATAANVHHFVASGYTSADCTTGEIGPIYVWAPGAELQVRSLSSLQLLGLCSVAQCRPSPLSWAAATAVRTRDATATGSGHAHTHTRAPASPPPPSLCL